MLDGEHKPLDDIARLPGLAARFTEVDNKRTGEFIRKAMDVRLTKHIDIQQSLLQVFGNVQEVVPLDVAEAIGPTDQRDCVIGNR